MPNLLSRTIRATFAGLNKAAGEFGPPKPTVSESGTATARFVGNE